MWKGAMYFCFKSEARFKNLPEEIELRNLPPQEEYQKKPVASNWKPRDLKILLILASLVLVLATICTGIWLVRLPSSCKSELKEPEEETRNKTDAGSVPVFSAQTYAATSAILIRRLNSVNTTADPCENFYEFACGSFSEDSYDLRQTTINTLTMTKAILKSPPTADDEQPLAEAKTHFKSCVGLSLPSQDERDSLEIETSCDTETRSIFGLDIGSKYIELIGFDAVKRREMEHFLQTMIDEFKSILLSADWIDDTSKAKLLDKLLKIKSDVGYSGPDQIKLMNLDSHIKLLEDASSYMLDKLQILQSKNIKEFNNLLSDMQPGSSAVDNILKLPTTVNAFAYLDVNGIYIPTVLFQQPFYDGQALPALNYGSLGHVMGHEIMHNFDTEGIVRDGTGHTNKTWLSHEFFSVYNNKSVCFKLQYDVKYPRNNGYATVDENISDNEGIRIAFNAFRRMEGNSSQDYLGYTSDQLFFLASAQFHCHQDPFASHPRHSYSALRVNGMMRNMPEFYEAWNCKIPERQMCRIF